MSSPASPAPEEWLYDCIQRLAAGASNPVLELLQGVTQVEQNKKYPEHGLSFAHLGVRAFYHCHDAVSAHANEHGHFHVFLAPDDKQVALSDWVHLAGLSMDQFGQPLRWFSVNRWVGGGQWRTAPELTGLLEQVPTSPKLLLVEEWLLAMLKVFHQEIEQLLIARDHYLTQHTVRTTLQAILDNRHYYELSTCTIDLLTKFQQHENSTTRR